MKINFLLHNYTLYMDKIIKNSYNLGKNQENHDTSKVSYNLNIQVKTMV